MSVGLKTIALVVFITGGLVSGTIGLKNLTDVARELDAPVAPADPVTAPAATPPPRPDGSRPMVDVPTPRPEPQATGAWLFVVNGDLWQIDDAGPLQLTHDGLISQPAVGAAGLAFVQRSRNASDVWLASAGSAPRPLTRNSSPTVAQNHWAGQPVFLPGRRQLYVLGDFNKASTGVGDLAIWEMSPGGELPIQITRPPEYTGGDQDVTVDPTDPRHIIFTRYSYVGAQVVEQLQWLDVVTDNLVALTASDRPTRQAAFAPDARRLAFVQRGPDKNEDLYLADVVISSGRPELVGMRQVVSGTIAYPAWSADGSSLAYLAATSSGFQLWSVAIRRTADNQDAVGEARQLTNGPSLDATSRPVYLTASQVDDVRRWLATPAP